MRKLFVIIGLLWASACQKKEEQKAVTYPADFLEELWYKNSVIYNLDVEVFKDSDGDGYGDFRGLTEKLSYLKQLGIDVIWLAPFQPTPNQDDGYDITDFYGIDPHLGTFQDFDNFIAEAGKTGIRVMMDMVVNHTSDQHPWFKQARANRNSPYRSWYYWRDTAPEKAGEGMVFPGVQKSVWTYDSVAGQYYYNRFYRFQPDMNAQNPAVMREWRKIMGFWLGKGIAGFRLDAVPFMVEVPGDDPNNPEHEFDKITQLHDFVQWRKGNAIMLGEANVSPEEQENYFGKRGENMQMLFNFFVNQHLFYALATGETNLLVKALNDTRTIPSTAQWAHFLRNHDEIDLARLSDKERDKVYARFGPDTNMQLYDRGIRRRLTPMLGNRQLIDLAYALVFTLPGTPVLRYGEEIGMGDDLELKERMSIRTPMQWSNAVNAGFSANANTVRPVISTGDYSYLKVNVASQQQDSSSLLRMVRNMIRLRKDCPEIGLGNWQLIDAGNEHAFGIQYEWQGKSTLVVYNFHPQQQEIRMPLKVSLRSLTDQSVKQPDGDQGVKLTLDGYGFQWFRVK